MFLATGWVSGPLGSFCCPERSWSSSPSCQKGGHKHGGLMLFSAAQQSLSSAGWSWHSWPLPVWAVSWQTQSNTSLVHSVGGLGSVLGLPAAGGAEAEERGEEPTCWFWWVQVWWGWRLICPRLCCGLTDSAAGFISEDQRRGRPKQTLSEGKHCSDRASVELRVVVFF